MRLATWNVDGGRVSAAARAGQQRQVGVVAADAWVLTEADPALAPTGHTATTSAGACGDVHDVVLTGAELQPLVVPETSSAAAGVVTVDGAEWLVVGALLPAVAAAGARPSQSWLPVAQQLAGVLDRLTAEHPDLPLLLAGDLAQTLTRHVVGSRVGRARLVELLQRHALVAYTADARSARAGCAAVDHVCGPARPVEVETWSTIDAEAAVLLSDHLGYVVEL